MHSGAEGSERSSWAALSPSRQASPGGPSQPDQPQLPLLGTPRLHLRVAGSTNDEGRRLATRGAPHGTLITASEQTSGRGRHGRRWSAPPGQALLMSLLLRRWPQLLPLAVPLAVCDVAGEDALVKWPNDVVVREGAAATDTPRAAGETEAEGAAEAEGVAEAEGARLCKLAGILIEGRPQEGWLVVGIGLNVAVDLGDMPAELQSTATTMGRRPEDVEDVLGDLLAALEQRLSEPSGETVAAWRARDALLGQEVSFAGGVGVAEGIDDGGRLRVRAPDGSLSLLDSGEVVLADGPLDEIARRCADLPVLDDRSEDEILGYDDHGLPT